NRGEPQAVVPITQPAHCRRDERIDDDEAELQNAGAAVGQMQLGDDEGEQCSAHVTVEIIEDVDAGEHTEGRARLLYDAHENRYHEGVLKCAPMSTLKDILTRPGIRPQVIADCERLIDEE